jgi:hypothetical protein
MKDLQLNHTYLIKHVGLSDILSSIKILLVTNEAYYIRWNSGLDIHDEWITKHHMELYHYLVEDISDFITTEKKSETPPQYKWVQCYVCKGFGTIPDNTSTGGIKLCPLCNGAKMVVDTIETK